MGNGPVDSTDPSGLEDLSNGVGPDSFPRTAGPQTAAAILNTLPNMFRVGDPARYPGGTLSFPGNQVMSNLGIRKYAFFGWDPFGGKLKQAYTDEYNIFKQGCVGLNQLRLNSTQGPFKMSNTRAFTNLEAAIEAQKQMLRQYDKNTRIVISAYQDNYLDEQLVPLLLPNSQTEYDLNKLNQIEQGRGLAVEPKGSLRVYDYITIHQKCDLSVLFYETMNNGVTDNSGLYVKHKTKLYPPQSAGTVYFVTPIGDHARAPLSPRGTK